MNFKDWAVLLLGCALSILAGVAQAQDAAAVSTTSGTVIVQKADGSVRSLAPGSMLQSGDVVSTQPNSSARLKFTDGGELTVSANSQFKIDAYRFNTAAPKEDNVVLSLIKGGLRSITGLIGRRGNRDAYRLQTATATIGIRGTDYIARLCGDDCAKEVAQIPSTARAVAPDISARVAMLSGQAVAVSRLGAARPLAVGSAIYTGDIVETRANSYAVLAFLDEGRVTLRPEARFLIERFRYEPTHPEGGLSVARLLRGSVRVLTGLLAKKEPRNYRVETIVATIGIRGTGFDALCSGPCEDNAGTGKEPASAPTPPPDDSGGLFVNTWQGEVEVKNAAGSQTVSVGQTVRVSAKDKPPVQVPDMPPFLRDEPGPRPDGLQIELRQLFGAGTAGQDSPGLYVLVKEGSILLTQDGTTLQLERGESAYASFDQTQLYRLQFTPTFIERDNVLSAPSAGGLFCGFGFH